VNARKHSNIEDFVERKMSNMALVSECAKSAYPYNKESRRQSNDKYGITSHLDVGRRNSNGKISE
jgi:hypothetical protein